MAIAYPLSVFSLDTQIVPRPTVQIDAASDGTVRGRVIQDQEVFDASVGHKLITQAQKDTLLAFYDANRAAEIELTYAGETYHLYFTGRPIVSPMNGTSVWWQARVNMVGGLSV